MASQTLRSLAGRAKLAFTDAAPVILFFLIAFYSILWLFGVKYIIVVSVLATLFKVRCRKRQTMAKLLSMAAVQLSLAVLASCGPLADPVCDSQYSGSVSFGVPAIHSIQSERLFHQRHGLCVFPAEPGGCLGVRTFSLRHDLRPAAIGRGASHLLPRQGAGCGLRAGTAGLRGSGGTSFGLGGGGGKCGGRGAAFHPARALQTGGTEPGISMR